VLEASVDKVLAIHGAFDSMIEMTQTPTHEVHEINGIRIGRGNCVGGDRRNDFAWKLKKGVTIAELRSRLGSADRSTISSGNTVETWTRYSNVLEATSDRNGNLLLLSYTPNNNPAVIESIIVGTSATDYSYSCSSRPEPPPAPPWRQ